MCTLEAEINHRLASRWAKVAFLQLQKLKAKTSRTLSLPTNLLFLQSIVMSALLYGGETFMLLSKHLAPLSVLYVNCL